MGFVNAQSDSAVSASAHARMEFSEITPALFVGTNACCATHYKIQLIDRGILNDISLEGEKIDAPFGVETFLWLPTEDHTAPTQMDLHLGVDYITSVIAHAGKVYVHCKNGHGRGPTLAAAWLIHEGRSVEEAIASVKERRPEIHLEDSQMDALRAYAASL